MFINYECRVYIFISLLRIFVKDVQKHHSVTYHPYQESFWTQRQSRDEKLEMLKIDMTGNVDIMLGLGKVYAEGSFHYLDEKIVRNISLFQATITTSFRIFLITTTRLSITNQEPELRHLIQTSLLIKICVSWPTVTSTKILSPLMLLHQSPMEEMLTLCLRRKSGMSP